MKSKVWGNEINKEHMVLMVRKRMYDTKCIQKVEMIEEFNFLESNLQSFMNEQEFSNLISKWFKDNYVLKNYEQLRRNLFACT